MPEDFDLADVMIVEDHSVVTLPIQTFDPNVVIMVPFPIILN